MKKREFHHPAPPAGPSHKGGKKKDDKSKSSGKPAPSAGEIQTWQESGQKLMPNTMMTAMPIITRNPHNLGRFPNRGRPRGPEVPVIRWTQYTGIEMMRRTRPGRMGWLLRRL